MADLHEIELGDGTRIKTALSAERLADWGIAPAAGPSLGDRGATAGIPVLPSDGGVSQIPGLAGAIGTGGGQRVKLEPLRSDAAPPGLPVESAESVAASDKEAAKAIDKAREGTDRTPGLRGGGEVKELSLEQGDQGAPGYAPPRPRYVTIKAGNTKGADIRTGFTVQKSAASDALPEYQERQDNARIDQKLAAQQMADVKTETLKREIGDAEADRTLADAARLQAERRQAAAEARQQKATQDVAAHQAEWDQIQKDKVNPNDYWEGLGTGGKILAGIAMLAGGVRAGLQGGPNQAIGFIRSAIRDNINDQKDRLEARRQGYNVKKTMLEKNAELLGGDLELAAQMLEAKQLAVVQAMMRTRDKTGSLAAVPAELAAFNASLDAEGADKMMQALGQYGTKVTEQNQFIPDKTVMVGGPVAMKPEARERMVTFGEGGQRGFVVAGNARDKVQSAISGFQNIAGGIRELKSLAAQASAGNLEAQRRYNSLRSALLTEANVLRGQGAMSEGDQGNMEAGMPDVAKLTTTRGEAASRLDEQERWSNQRLRATVRDNVYADPDATTPALRGDSGGVRRE